MTSGIWLLGTFMLSSKLFVYVGFVVADRTLYLPSFGFCLLLAEAVVSLSSLLSSALSAWLGGNMVHLAIAYLKLKIPCCSFLSQ